MGGKGLIEISLIDAEFRKTMAALRAATVDLSPLMTKLAGHLAAASKRAFDHETDPNTGEPWAPLRASTIKSRAARGYTGKKLQATGLLAASIRPTSGGDFAQITVASPYGIFHQLGTGPYTIEPKGKKALAWPDGLGSHREVRRKVNHPGLPARPFVGVDEQTIADIRDEVRRYYQKVLGG